MLKRISYALAAFLWIVCSYELLMIVVRYVRGNVAETRFVGTLLAQPKMTDLAAPWAVLIVFAWVLLQAFGHARRIWREQSALQHFRGDSGALERSVADDLRAARRGRLLRQHALSPPRLGETLPAAAALDAAALENSYGLARACVWTLPVLGFIGTAWGMATAISGFSEALQEASGIGNHEQLELLTNRLGQLVIPGLAHAFSITMMALALSIISHFWVTTLHSWDQDVLEELDRISLDKLAEKIPAGGSGPDPQLMALYQLLTQISGQLEEIKSAESLKEAGQAHLMAAEELSGAAAALKRSVGAPYKITIERGDEEGA